MKIRKLDGIACKRENKLMTDTEIQTAQTLLLLGIFILELFEFMVSLSSKKK